MRLLALLLLSTASALFNVTRLPAGTSTHTITSGGRTRTFIVNKGSGVGDSNPAGLVVLFHGFTQTASQMCSQANAASIASTNKFISVCAQGLSNSWNAGACCGTAQLQNIDDVSFAKDIVKYVSGASKVDASKVFAAGFSNGGMMSYRLACQASDVFRGAGPAAGTYFGNVYPGFTCAPQNARNIIHFHDTLDPVVNFAVSLAAYQVYVTGIEICPWTSYISYANPVYFGQTCYERKPCARNGKGSLWCQTTGLLHTFPNNALQRMWNYWTTGKMTNAVKAA